MGGNLKGVREFDFTHRQIKTDVFAIGMGWGFRIEFIDDRIVIGNINVYDSSESADHAVNEILLNYFDVDSKLTLLHKD